MSNTGTGLEVESKETDGAIELDSARRGDSVGRTLGVISSLDGNDDGELVSTVV